MASSRLSPAAQAVWDAAWQLSPVNCKSHEDRRRQQIAAALRALTRTPLVNEAHMRGWVVSAIATEDILNLAAELEGKND